MNELLKNPLKLRLDSAKTPQNRQTGLNEIIDFQRYTRKRLSVLNKQPTSRI